MKRILTIRSRGEGYTADLIDLEDGSYSFIGDMDNDQDGTPFWHKDPCGAPDTTLHHNGKPIDGSIVPGIVLPPECIKAVRGIVLGCKAEVVYKGRVAAAVVFDVGPHNKLGEGNPALMTDLGIPWTDDGNGGVDGPHVTYRFWPGQPAVLNGIVYQLHPYRA